MLGLGPRPWRTRMGAIAAYMPCCPFLATTHPRCQLVSRRTCPSLDAQVGVTSGFRATRVTESTHRLAHEPRCGLLCGEAHFQGVVAGGVQKLWLCSLFVSVLTGRIWSK